MMSQYDLEIRIKELESFNWRKEKVPKIPKVKKESKKKVPKQLSEQEALIAKLKREGKL